MEIAELKNPNVQPLSLVHPTDPSNVKIKVVKNLENTVMKLFILFPPLVLLHKSYVQTDHVQAVVVCVLPQKAVIKIRLDVGITHVLIQFLNVKQLFRIKKSTLQILLLDVQMVLQELIYWIAPLKLFAQMMLQLDVKMELANNLTRNATRIINAPKDKLNAQMDLVH